MVNKGIAGAVGGGIAILIAAVLIFVASPFQLGGQIQPQTGEQGAAAPQVMQDVVLTVNSINIKEIDQESAMIEVAFDMVNPNRNTLVLEEIRYELFTDGTKLKQSTIGERLAGAVAGTGQTYYLVSDVPLTLKDTVQIKKTNFLAKVWGSLESNDAEWRIKGSYIVTDPVRLGGQEKDFDLTL